MEWALAGVTLVLVAFVCRRILQLDRPLPRSRALTPLSRNRQEVYQPVSLEIETQTAILGVSLNEALGERDSGNVENALRLVRLAVCQWDRLAEVVTVMLKAIGESVPAARSIMAVRGINPDQFRSNAIAEVSGTQAALEQLVFRSRVRYQIHVRFLRRSVDALTAEFRRSYRSSDREATGEIWRSLDPSFHDFDLVIKESLLAFRILLIALPDAALPAFTEDLKGIVSRSVRAKSVAASR
ncbi:MAG TPA: hypothetical protein VFZ08_14880 [Terriglobia bacterium]|nr:hypothetical protein [Terriglobia bacterium]